MGMAELCKKSQACEGSRHISLSQNGAPSPGIKEAGSEKGDVTVV